MTKNVLISVNANGSLQHWHTTSGKLLHTIHDELNQLLTVDYKPDGTAFATGGSDCIVRVYDEQTRKLKVTLEGGGTGEPGHSNRVFALKFDKDDDNMLLSGGWDNNVKIWDIRSGQAVRSIYGPYICGDALDIHDGYVLTGSWRGDKQLQMWDVGTSELVDDLSWNKELGSATPCQLYCAQFLKTEGDLIIAGGSGSNEVKIFDGNNNFWPCAQIRDLSRACFTVDFSNQGDMFAMGGGDGVVRVFNIINSV